MSASEPESPKPHNAVEQEVSNELDNLKAENEKLTQELAERDAELATVTADRDELRSQLATVQIENEALRADNERLQKELAKAAENYQTLVIIDRQLNQQVEEARSQLATVQADNERLNRELEEAQSQANQVRQEYTMWRQKLVKVKEEPGIRDRQPTTMKSDQDELRSQLAEPEQKPAPAIKLPEPADLLNQLKSKRKKSTASLADVEKILEILEASSEN